MNPVLLLVLLALAVVGLAALVFVLIRVSLKGSEAPSAWPAVAERLGLQEAELPVGDGTLSGRRLGFEVAVTVETPSRKTRRLRARAALVPPLEIGLVLGPFPDASEPRPGCSPFATGNPTVDRQLEPRVRDARRARRLFERKALRDRLEAALGRWSVVDVGDDHVTLGVEHPALEAPPLDDLLDDLTAIARLLDEDRQRIRDAPQH